MAFTVVPPTVADVEVSRSMPKDADAVGIAVSASGTVPRAVGLSRTALEANGFEAKAGQTLRVPVKGGPAVVAVGTGDDELTIDQVRNAAAAVVRATGNSAAHVAINLADDHSNAAGAARAVTEGALLAAYRYVGLKNDTSSASKLSKLTVVVGGKAAKPAESAVADARVAARAGVLTRELANTPANLLNARDLADLAITLGEQHNFAVEVYNRDQLEEMGCGGILGVNKGSIEPPRVIKVTYKPNRPRKKVALVGKGVMYDSGGISLKPSNAMHVQMKMDMAGAAAVLSTMTALDELGCRNQVTAWLMCTDNMPSGSALKLSDVLTFRNGKTAEIHNTDAEGRLCLADGLCLAAETEPDVMIDIATLTGAVMGALGNEFGGVIGSAPEAVDAIKAAAEHTGEPVWELPLAKDRYRKLLDSDVADMKNIGGPYAGATTAAIFLSEFTDDRPWAHLDIAGVMNADADDGWKSKGATGFGTRLLIDVATSFNA